MDFSNIFDFPALKILYPRGEIGLREIAIYWGLFFRDRQALFLLSTIPLPIICALIIFLRDSAKTAKNHKFLNLLFLICISIMPFAFRWVFIGASELNPDEGEVLAGAARLSLDPVYWRSFDGHTWGPVPYYILLSLNFFGMPLNYAWVHLLAIVINSLTLICLYYSLQKITSTSVSMISVMIPTMVLSLTKDAQFIYYSGEHVSNLLLGISLVFSFGLMFSLRTSSFFKITISGLFIGLIPFGKPQAAPLAIVLAFFVGRSLLTSTQKPKSFLIFAISLVAPSLFFITMVLASGAFLDFWNSFIVKNLLYAGRTSASLVTLLKIFVIEFFSQEDTLPTLLLPVMFLFFLTLLALKNLRKLSDRTLNLLVFAICLLAASVFSVALPFIASPTHHYLLLLLPSFAILSGAAFEAYKEVSATWTTSKCSVPRLVSILTTITILFALLSNAPHKNWLMAHLNESSFKLNNSVIRELKILSHRGEQAIIWGWCPKLYVETRLIPGTREAHTQYQSRPSPLKEFFQNRFIQEMKSSPARIFVDCTKTKAPWTFLADPMHWLENNPQIAAEVIKKFSLYKTVEGTDIYLAN